MDVLETLKNLQSATEEDIKKKQEKNKLSHIKYLRMEKRKKSMASRMRMKEVFILRKAGPALMSKYNERLNG